MTLASIKKLAIKLPLRDRLKLADAMWDSIPPMRAPCTLEELEQRIAEVESGKVKALTSEEFIASMDEMEKRLIKGARASVAGRRDR